MPNTNYQTIHQMGSAVNDILKQATGRDDVQNIDMDFVTVARNHCAVHEEYSGSVASFEAHVETPMGLIVQIDPVQDLHGFDMPWPAGGGANIFEPFSGTYQGITFTPQSDGTVEISGTSTTAGWKSISSNRILLQDFGIAPGDTLAIWSTHYLELRFYDSNNTNIGGIASYNSESKSYTVNDNAVSIMSIQSYKNGGVDAGVTINETAKYFVGVGSSFTAWSPYSNICPISGWTGCNVTVSPTQYAEDGTTYSITFPSSAGTVYGGELTVNKDGTGTLVIDSIIIDLLGNTFTKASSGDGRFILAVNPLSVGRNSEVLSTHFKGITETDINESSPFVFMASDSNLVIQTGDESLSTVELFNTWLTEQDTAGTPVKVLYKLATPDTYNLTNLDQIKTLIGTNNVWADTGDITVQFTDIVED